MGKLAETLGQMDVPAILGTVSAMHLLLGNARVIFGGLKGEPAQFIIGLAITSSKAGLGLDVGLAMAEYCKAAINCLRTWVLATGTEYENGVQNASTRLYTEMGMLFDQDMCERAEAKREFSPESYYVLFGSDEQLKRNAHTESRGTVGGHFVEWSALLAPGGLRPFCISVVGALHYEANKTGIDRILQCMFGTSYSSDVDSVESLPGARNGLYGAIVTCQLTGHAAIISGAMRNWVPGRGEVMAT